MIMLPVVEVILMRLTQFSPKNTSQLEDIKRSLLQKGDWVGLSISRPLHMRFPRFDEKNMIGRRRKVSHGTKTRNTVLDRQSAVSPSKCSNTTQSHGSQWASEGPLHTRHKSPGSMLLDVDGAESGQLLESSSWNVDSGDLWLFHDDFADRTEQDGLVLHEFSLTEDCGSSVTVHEYEDRNATVLSPDNQLQARNRFTLDDQILEEQMKANRKRSAFMDTHNSEFGDLAICNPCSRKTDDNRSDVSPVFESTDMLGRRSVSSVLQWNNPDSPGQAAKMSKQWGPASQETNARSPLVIFGKRISPQSTARPLQTWCPSSFHIQDHYYQRRNGESRKSSDAYFGEPSENSRQELEQSPTSESYPFAIKIHRNTTTMSYTQRTPMTPSAYNNALVATPSSFRTSETSPFRFRSLHAEH